MSMTDLKHAWASHENWIVDNDKKTLLETCPHCKVKRKTIYFNHKKTPFYTYIMEDGRTTSIKPSCVAKEYKHKDNLAQPKLDRNVKKDLKRTTGRNLRPLTPEERQAIIDKAQVIHFNHHPTEAIGEMVKVKEKDDILHISAELTDEGLNFEKAMLEAANTRDTDNIREIGNCFCEGLKKCDGSCNLLTNTLSTSDDVKKQKVKQSLAIEDLSFSFSQDLKIDPLTREQRQAFLEAMEHQPPIGFIQPQGVFIPSYQAQLDRIEGMMTQILKLLQYQR